MYLVSDLKMPIYGILTAENEFPTCLTIIKVSEFEKQAVWRWIPIQSYIFVYLISLQRNQFTCHLLSILTYDSYELSHDHRNMKCEICTCILDMYVDTSFHITHVYSGGPLKSRV